jgi:hypothetical protein
MGRRTVAAANESVDKEELGDGHLWHVHRKNICTFAQLQVQRAHIRKNEEKMPPD